MVKQGLLNFFKNLKYCFTSLGTLFLGVLFGICFLASGMKAQINQAVTDIQTITEEANIDTNDLKNCIVDSFSEVSWEDPVQAVKTITSREWLDGTLKVNLENTIENYKLYAEDIEKAVSSAVSGYVKYIVAFALCSAAGLILGFFLTRYFVRQSIAKIGLGKFIFTTLLDSVIAVAITLLSLWLTMLWRPSVLVVSILGIIIYGLVSLFEAYLIHGYKKVPFREAVNMKNAMLLFVTNLLIYIFSFAISEILVAATNPFVGIFVAIPLLIIAINVISLNAESYMIKFDNISAQKKLKRGKKTKNNDEATAQISESTKTSS